MREKVMRLYQRKNGFWYVEIHRGKKRSLKTKEFKKAKGIFKEIEREYLSGRLVKLDKGKRVTLGEYKETFLQTHCDIADDTRTQYELALRLLMDSIGGSTLLSRVERGLPKFIADCRARGVKPVSINNYLRGIRTPLNKAYEWGLLDRKPFIKMLRVEKRLPRILTMQEIAAILRYARRHDFEMYRIILFALWTGARRSEVASARWKNYTGDTIRIIGKGNRERTIPVLPMTAHAMGDRRDIGFIFKRWHNDTTTHRFRGIVRELKIKNVHFHTLRHTAATMMLASGIGISYVKQILGHASVTTTEIYAQVLQDKLKQEMWDKLVK